MGLQTIPARKGKAAKLRKGDCIKVINTHGTQVIDTWAFNQEDLAVCRDATGCDARYLR